MSKPTGGVDAVQDDRGFAEACLASQLEDPGNAVVVFESSPPCAAYDRAFAEMWHLGAEGGTTDDPASLMRELLAQAVDPGGLRACLSGDAVASSAGGRYECEIDLRDERILRVQAARVFAPPAASKRGFGRRFVFRDVTAQRRSERRIRTAHAFLAETERLAHVGGWAWELALDRFAWSEETARMLGRNPGGEPTLADFLAAIHREDRARVRADLEASAKLGRPFRAEFRIQRPDGATRILDSRADAVRDAEGDVTRLVGTLQDITERRAVEQGLEFAHDLCRAQLESSPDGILVVSADRKIVSFNRRFVDLWALPPEVVRDGDDQRALASALGKLKDPDAFVARVEELYAHPDLHSYEEIELADGRVFERHSGPLPIAPGEPPGRIFFFRDVTGRRRAEERVTHLALHDELTGLANRGEFVGAIQRAIERSEKGAKRFAVLYLDLDHFKDVNDTLGHPAGDRLLKIVAERLARCVREPDVVARFGGDEFAILEAEASEPSQVAALADRVQCALREPYPIFGSDIRIGVSIGMTLFGPEASNAETLLSQADLALYRAKADGRGTSRFYAKGLDVEVRARVELVSDLRAALYSQELFLVYQPQIEIATGRIVGVEALARWRHPRRGFVPPDVFIPAAERSGLVIPFGRWVLREACRQAKAWMDAGILPEVVAINVSGAQFRSPVELESTISAALAEHALPPNRVELELTESVLMDAWLEQREVLAHLRESGVKIAIDDFGTGFSSLQYLSRFPVDRLKIDRGFVADLRDNASNAAIVKATIGLARELGLRVVAEGVETAEQLERLRAWGCGDAQGFYFARPMPPAEIESLLRNPTFARPSASPRAPAGPRPQPGASSPPS